MKNIIYIHGESGSGKTFFCDDIEDNWILNEGYNSYSLNDSNFEEIIEKLNSFQNTLLVIKSDRLQKEHYEILKEFVKNENFQRGVVIQSEFEPNLHFKDFCQIYETGYPYFAWVTKIGKEWKGKRINSDEIFTSSTKINAIELARRYK